MIGTNSAEKTKEIKYLLDANDYTLITPSDLQLDSPPETGETFFENAEIKALYYGNHAKIPVISEDAGLCVDALNGAPGIATADWAKEAGSIAQFFRNIKGKISGLSNSKAEFKVCFVYYNPLSKQILSSQSVLQGHIDFSNIDEEAFGFDAFFIPLGYDKPLSAFSFEEKMQISPRKQALNNILERAA